jgi:hypothetical protein
MVEIGFYQIGNELPRLAFGVQRHWAQRPERAWQAKGSRISGKSFSKSVLDPHRWAKHALNGS